MTGLRFSLTTYRPPSAAWDHDHCEFCSTKIARSVGQLDRAYVSNDGRHWVCSPCFEDFRDEYGWSVRAPVD